MANTVRLKRSAVQGKAPATTDLELGELAVNTFDGKLYTKKNDGSDSIVDLSGGGDWTEGTNILYPANSSNAVLVGGTLPSAPNITLNTDGVISAEEDATINGVTVGKGASSVASNTAVGVNALQANTSGINNTATGSSALYNNLNGNYNTAFGYRTLYGNTTGFQNTAVGYNALKSNVDGFYNTAYGSKALEENIGGDYNTCTGWASLSNNTTGSNNTGIGYEAGKAITSGSNNTCLGYQAAASSATATNEITLGNSSITKFRVPGINFILKDNTLLPTTGQVLTADSSGEGYWADSAGLTNTAADPSTSIGIGTDSFLSDVSGEDSVAVGHDALRVSTAGFGSTAIGFESMKAYNNTGFRQGENTAVGRTSLLSLTTGVQNTAVGSGAMGTLTTNSNNTALGRYAAQTHTGSNCTFLGHSSGNALATTGQNLIVIGYASQASSASADNEITLGNTTISKFRVPGINFILKDNTLLPTTGQVLTADSSGEGYWADNSPNTAAVTSTSYGIGTDSFLNDVSSADSVAIGHDALRTATTGNKNTAIGSESMKSYNNTSSSQGKNTAVGFSSLKAITTGQQNTAIGETALTTLSTTNNNTALGRAAGFSHTGSNSVFIGDSSGNFQATTGSNIMVAGYGAAPSSTSVSNEITLGNSSITKFRVPGINFILKDNALLPTTGQVLTADSSGEGYWADGPSGFETIASGNIAESFRIGTNALSQLTTLGNYSFAAGYEAMKDATTGATSNIAIGYRALKAATTADYNIALGYDALLVNATGGWNFAAGQDSMIANTSGTHNVAIGYQSLSSNIDGTSNVALGRGALDSNTTGDYNVGIGKGADVSSPTVNGEITLGGTDHTALRCNVQTISSLSDGRDKTEVEELPEGLAFISNLKPVKFKWETRDGNTKDGTYEAGFIAQDLQSSQAAANADYMGLVMDSNPERLEASYGKLIPVLVKAIQELKAEVELLKANT